MNSSIGYGQKPMEIETHTDGQLTAMNMRAVSCQTIHNSGHNNMQFVVWPVHRTFARQ